MLAIVPVVLYHAGAPGFGGGFVGVDVFFVISGFLITGILRREIEDGRYSVTAFYERRVRRIVPALIVVIFACLVAGFVFLLPRQFDDLAKSAIATLLFTSNVWFYVQSADYFAPAAETQMLLHTWSLAVEEQFYIIFPLLMWWLMSRTRRALDLIVLLCGASFLLSVFLTHTRPTASFYLMPGRFWELGIGAALALMAPQRRAPPLLLEAAAAIGCAMIAISVALYSDQTPFPGVAAMLPCLGAALIIWAGGLGTTRAGRLLSAPLPVGIGLISYSLYLWHWPVLVLFWLRFGSSDLPPAATAAAVAIATGAAWASWRFVERPFRRRGRVAATRARVFGVAGLASAALGVASLAIVAMQGLPGRLPEAVQRVLEVADEEITGSENCASERAAGILCDLGLPTPGRQDVLLWGDSHAGALSSGLDRLLREKGRSGALAYRLACPPILGVERLDGGFVKGCIEFNDRVIAELRSRSDLQTVILYSRWRVSSEGRGAWPRALLREEGHVDKSGGEAANFAVFEAAFTRTIAAIAATGRRIIVIEGTPEMVSELPVVIARNMMSGTPIPDMPDAANVHALNERTNRVIEAAAKLGDVTVLDPVPILCDPVCRIAVDGIPLYFDSDHLSSQGADFLAPRLLGEALHN